MLCTSTRGPCGAGTCGEMTMSNESQRGRLLRYSSIGVEFTVLFGAGVAGGMFMDDWLNAWPGFTVIGTTAGFLVALRRLVAQGRQIEREGRNEPPADGRDARK